MSLWSFLQPILALESRSKYLLCLLAFLYALSPSVVNEFSVLVLVMVGFFSSEKNLCAWGTYPPKLSNVKASIEMFWSLSSVVMVLPLIEIVLLIFEVLYYTCLFHNIGGWRDSCRLLFDMI